MTTFSVGGIHPQSSAARAHAMATTLKPEPRVEQAPAPVVDATLGDRLQGWFDCFRGGSAQWGLVDNWRDDGTCVKRHGIVVTLRLSLASILRKDDAGRELTKLREAIDIIQLVLAVQASAIQPLVDKGEFEWSTPPTFVEELAAIARGVPVELRLRFDVGVKSTKLLMEYRFFAETNMALDGKLSTNEAFLAVRQELMARLDGDDTKLLQLNTRTARAVLVVKGDFDQATSAAKFVGFLDNLTVYAEMISAYQRDRRTLFAATTMATRHTLLVVEKIEMGSGPEVMTSRVMDSAMELMVAGLPVDWSWLHLDLRLVECDEEQLRRFLGAVAERSTSLRVDTIEESFDEIDVYAIDADDRGDRLEMIRMILRCIGSIGGHLSELNMDGLLGMCSENHNREALWHGLFEDVLSPDSRLEQLTLTHQANLLRRDAAWIMQYASEWRDAHPNQKLRVKCLILSLIQAQSFEALRALLSAFDDIEEIYLSGYAFSRESISPEIFDALLVFPSLRKLRVVNALVPTMDLFDPTIADETRPFKPVLDELELKDIILQDVSSLRRFLTSLDPSKSASPFATTLQKLQVTQDNRGALNQVDFYDPSTLVALTDMLQSNRVLSDITIACDTSNGEQMKQLLTHNGRNLPARLESRNTALTKSCIAAFLSTIDASNCGTTSARARLDTTHIRQIFEFTAARLVTRTIQTFHFKRVGL